MQSWDYKELTAWIHAHPPIEFLLTAINFFVTYGTYGLYILLLFFLGTTGHGFFWKLLLLPGICFIIFSLVRIKVDAPRPYEQQNFTPLIAKNSAGNSFPSRHIFSVFVIGTTLGMVSMPIMIILTVMGILLGFARVLLGVHYVKDVIIGAIAGIICGMFAYFI